MNKQNTFVSVYQEMLAEIYDAEKQMIEALPRIIRAASSEELKTALDLHLAETREQAARLETILGGMEGIQPLRPSDAMRALLAKSKLAILWREQSPVLDAAIVATARQIEYYEIGSYSGAHMMARMLNEDRAAALLARSLKQEQETAADLAQIAETVIMGEELEDAELAEAS